MLYKLATSNLKSRVTHHGVASFVDAYVLYSKNDFGAIPRLTMNATNPASIGSSAVAAPAVAPTLQSDDSSTKPKVSFDEQVGGDGSSC